MYTRDILTQPKNNINYPLRPNLCGCLRILESNELTLTMNPDIKSLKNKIYFENYVKSTINHNNYYSKYLKDV